jgi:asparagine synthase (glutamine-hydrolysing)
MCGIGGVVRFDGRSPEPAGVRAMVDALRHRGPDDQGMHVEGPVGLAHTRLSVIDLSAAAHQPMRLDEPPLWIVYNGETYNHRDLRRELEARGHRFRSSSDTEVILRAYVEWGEACVTRLNGMFAFAIWNPVEQRLFLARDRLGIKPLYYLVDPDSRELIFGSEIKTILAYRRHAPALDAAALDAYLAFGFVPLSRTPFTGLSKLPPAHTLTARGGTRETRRYWDVDFGAAGDRTRIADAELLQALQDAVSRNLVADVPVGAFLSGGIDSSAVVSFMRRSYPGSVKTFSVGFEQASYDERRFARLVARHLDTEHHEVVCTARDFRDLWARSVWHADGLAADISNVPLYMVAAAARRHVPVVLSGDGGDELFGGYPIYQADRLAAVYRRVPAPVRAVVGALAARLPASTEKLSLDFKLKQFLAGAQLGETARSHFSWRRIFAGPEREQLLTADLSVASRADIDDRLAALFRTAPAGTDLQRGIYADIKTFLVDSILAKVDAMTMAHGLEARVPLLDHELVELAARIPDRLKLRGMNGKRIFKTVMRGKLPAAVVERKKSPFHPPLAGWLRSDLRETVCEVLDEGRLKNLGLLNPSYVETLKGQHFTGAANHAFKLWALMNLVEWYRLFVEGHWQPETASAGARV